MSSTVWVKGELIDTLDGVTVDPRHLLKDPAKVPPFARLAWFQRVGETLEPGTRPLIARAWTEGSHGWLFLSLDRRGHASALANWYSLSFAPVFLDAADEPTQRRLLRAIAKRLGTAKSAPSVITLAPVARTGGMSRLIRSSFRKSGWLVLRHQSSTSWTVSTAGQSFADYWAERPGQLRSTHDRKRKKFGIEVEVMTDFDADAWAHYEAIYRDSWKPAEGDPAFLREFAEAEGKAGRLRLGLARIDGQPVAAQFWSVDCDTAYIHKLAHRSDAHDTSCGTILTAALFAHVIDVDHVALVDFGTGNDRYKADWMNASAPLDTIRLYNKRHISGWLGWVKARISALVHQTKLD